ncbi:MAG TPA: ABC transporter permease subunit [Opitutaceae bacterium]
MFRLHPQTRRKLHRFRQIRRGYVSFLIICGLVVIAMLAELLVGSRAILVRHDGRFIVPAYGAIHTGSEFGYDYAYEVNYNQLREDLAGAAPGFVLLPLVPFGPQENCYPGEIYKPRPPDWKKGHYLGTDALNRDVLSRLVYGLRNSLLFASGYVTLTFAIGIALGCAMGYFGGRFDLGVQRLIEIWSLVPFLFVVIIIRSVVPPGVGVSLGVLLGIVVLFSWTSMTYYMRSATYREKAREYVAAALVLGASTTRVIFRHVLPNTLSTIITFLPFQVAGSITALTALDYLGFGLQPPTPSWGELLKQGVDRATTAAWIVSSSFGALSITLVLVTFVGEAIREAFDPRRFTTYK